MTYPLEVQITHLSTSVPTELHGRLGDLYVYARSRSPWRRLYVGRRNDQPVATTLLCPDGIPDDVETYIGATQGFDDVFTAQAPGESWLPRAELLRWVDERLEEWQQDRGTKP